MTSHFTQNKSKLLTKGLLGPLQSTPLCSNLLYSRLQSYFLAQCGPGLSTTPHNVCGATLSSNHCGLLSFYSHFHYYDTLSIGPSLAAVSKIAPLPNSHLLPVSLLFQNLSPQPDVCLSVFFSINVNPMKTRTSLFSLIHYCIPRNWNHAWHILVENL